MLSSFYHFLCVHTVLTLQHLSNRATSPSASLCSGRSKWSHCDESLCPRRYPCFWWDLSAWLSTLENIHLKHAMTPENYNFPCHVSPPEPDVFFRYDNVLLASDQKYLASVIILSLLLGTKIYFSKHLHLDQMSKSWFNIIIQGLKFFLMTHVKWFYFGIIHSHDKMCHVMCCIISSTKAIMFYCLWVWSEGLRSQNITL